MKVTSALFAVSVSLFLSGEPLKIALSVFVIRLPKTNNIGHEPLAISMEFCKWLFCQIKQMDSVLSLGVGLDDLLWL
jgi:hypothetical protein